MQTPKLSAADVSEILKSKSGSYYAMYSSWLGGVVTEPHLMAIPMDDHLVHRGDGVFEAIKIVNGGVYLLEEHLDRLFVSAAKIGLGTQFLREDLKRIVLQTCKIGLEEIVQRKSVPRHQVSAIVRLFISRGPGSFSPNPYDTKGHQFYCVVTDSKMMSAEKYAGGVSVGKSEIPVKQGWFATVKSCNYLANVLMKKESVDRSLDFTVAFNGDGFLAESSTENIFLIDRNSRMIHPRWDYILKGTMMIRAFELAQENQWLSVIGAADISEADLLLCQGAFMVGTTLDVIPVTQYEGKKLPVSNIYEKLLKALRADQQQGSKKLTIID